MNSGEINSLEKLVEDHIENLGYLEAAEVDGKEFCSSFVCGWEGEDFLVSLAIVAESFKASIKKLTAEFDEGVYVCDLINGEPHLEEFEDYETYQETGFVNPGNKTGLSASNSNSLPEGYIGKWELDFKKALDLRIDELSQMWRELPDDKKEEYSSLENYILIRSTEEAKSESEILKITDNKIESVRKVYGNTVRENVTYSVTKIDLDTVFVTEYLEEYGGIEEFEVEMSLLESGNYLQIRQQRPKRVFVYRKI